MSNQGSGELRNKIEKNPGVSWDSLGPLLLLITALCYYAVYWHSGLMLSGEEGVAAVVAQRLNSGQLPIVDTFLGYNVGWFYPIAFLFKVSGPNYLVMRAFFFLMALLAGMAAYASAWLVSRRVGLSLLAGLLVTMMPGVIGRNYMGFLGVLGILTLLGVFVITPRKTFPHIVWMIALGASISLAWLVRIDLGVFQTTLFLLSSLLFLLKPQERLGRRLGLVVTAWIVLATSFLAIQGPVYRDAVQRGFGDRFSQQYLVWPMMIKNGAVQLLNSFSKPHTATQNQKATTSEHSTNPPSIATDTDSKPVTSSHKEVPASASYSDVSLKRPPLGDILHATKFKDRAFALLIYLPVLVSPLIVLWGLLLVLHSLVTSDPGLWRRGSILMVATGSALALFPQYFFWRPDMIHLGEFMVPFMVALILALYIACSAWNESRGLSRLGLLIVLLATGTNLGVYILKGWQTDSVGSIAASRHRHLEFTALNGVHVKLNPVEFSRATLLRDSILKNSKQGDYVVCYPYFPMVNFMTDRSSYEYNLYSDNAIPPEQFFDQAKANFERYQPAVIVIGTGRVNDTESSSFQNWASKTYAFIKDRYELVASDSELEIYKPKSR
jgi:hypothetical protein